MCLKQRQAIRRTNSTNVPLLPLKALRKERRKRRLILDYKKCIYCGETVDPSSEGDHIIPAALGEFRNDVRFRGICTNCNSLIGKSEQQLLRCGPTRLLRDIVVPQTARSRGKTTRWRGAEQAPPPKITVESEHGPLIAYCRSTPLEAEAPEQLVIMGRNSEEEHFVRLSPQMTPKALREKVRSTGIKGALDVRICCDQENWNYYLSIIKEAWPESSYEELPTIEEPGVRPTQLTATMRTNDHYWRALAKIAFHYYLCHSPRAKGNEEGFTNIRQFILKGGDPESFFPSSFRFPRQSGKILPTRWMHILAAAEDMDPVSVYICLFRGPLFAGEQYTVTIGHLQSAIYVPNPAWAHSYTYDKPTPPSGKVGEAAKVGLVPVRT